MIFHSPTITVVDTSLYWGVIRIEQVNNLGTDIEELSTFRTPVVGNILIPLTGETQTKKSIISGDLVLECQIDNTKLDPNLSYRPSARFGLNDSAATVPPIGGKLKEDGITKETEAAVFKIVDP